MMGETLAQRLRRLRDSKNLSAKEVAENIHVPLTTYREWENGRKIVGEPYLGLSKLFGISVYELITGEKSKNFEAESSIRVIETELAKVRRYLSSLE